MTGCFKVLMEASNEPCIHKSAWDVSCRQRLDQWHFPLGSSQAVEMIDNYGTQLMSVQLDANVMNIKIKIRLWLWNVPMGIAGYVQVCIDASNEPRIHESPLDVVCTAARPVALLQSNCGNDRQSWDSIARTRCQRSSQRHNSGGHAQGPDCSWGCVQVAQTCQRHTSLEEADCVCTYLGWDLILPSTQFKWMNEKWTDVISAGCRRDEPFIKKSKCCDCEMLHWALQGVYRSALNRAMSLASTNPKKMLPAESAAGPVALPLGEQPSCGNDRQYGDRMDRNEAGWQTWWGVLWTHWDFAHHQGWEDV